MAGLPFSADQLSRSPAKFSCRVATTGNITLVGSAPNTVDGVSLAAGDRILVWQQGTASQNGIYYVSTLGTGANGTWTRAKDADQNGDFEAGHRIYVSLGTLYQKQEFSVTNSGTIIVGTTGITFERVLFGSINDLTTKASPVTGDVLVIEDSAASFAKKKISFGALSAAIISDIIKFQPGGTAGGDTYITWGAVMTALAARTTTIVQLYFDDSLATCTIPSGTYDMTGVLWEGIPGMGTNVTLAAGVILTGLQSIRNLVLICNNTATAVMTKTVTNEEIILENTIIYNSGTSTKAFIRIGSGLDFYLEMHNSFVTSSDLGGYELFDHAGGSGTLIILSHDGSSIADDTLRGVAASVLDLEAYDPGSTLSLVQTNWAGTGLLVLGLWVNNITKALYETATGTNTYVVTMDHSPTAYEPGNVYLVKFTNSNTGPATLNVNGNGAQAIVKDTATALASGDIPANRVVELVYDGANFQIIGSVGSGGGAVVASSAELNTGTDNAKFASALALEGSKYLDQDGSKVYAVATGTDTYAVTLSPAPTAYAAGNSYAIRFTNANTGPATINVNALGAKSIVKGSATALVSGDIPVGQVCQLVYDGTNFSLEHIETNAFHGNVANEISALTEKTGLISTDLLLIEDSAAGNVKKKVQVSTLLDSQVLAKTTAYAVLTTDQGSLFTNEGAAVEIDFTLPAAATALGPYHFYNQDADGLRVIAGAGDTIRIGVGAGAVTAAAGNIKPQNPTDVGAFVTLVAINTTEWIAMSLNGAWTAT